MREKASPDLQAELCVLEAFHALQLIFPYGKAGDDLQR
jgi:hypothetical protein